MRDGTATRMKILRSANSLFYGAGIRAVSVDAIAEKAGITKKTLYYHFRSKDDLIAAYLESRDQPNVRQFAAWFDAAEGTLAERMGAVFGELAKVAARPRWRGCGFLRTAAELAALPGHPAVKAASAHKKSLEAWLSGVIAADGRDDPDRLARHIILLIDGAFSSVLMHRDPAYIDSAGQAARVILSQPVDLRQG